jgi:predicted GH43/DUF377 family glycosyl hydrolase/glycosyltransferase involved in cell wall biosynthesis
MINPNNDRGTNHYPNAKTRLLAEENLQRGEDEFYRETESLFEEAIKEPLNQANKIGKADIVVGIPFYNEADTIGAVLETVAKGLKQYYPDQKCLIVVAGSPAGSEALKVVKALPDSLGIDRISFLLDDERLNGKGWGVRAIIEITKNLGADLAIVEADLRNRLRDGVTDGLIPEWIHLLLEPIKRDEMDLVISRFNRHYLEAPLSTHLVYPLFTAIYNCPIHDLSGGQWGVSRRLLRTYLQDGKNRWSPKISGYGVDIWLATTAIANDARICEANLGIKIHQPSIVKTELLLHRIAEVLFEQLVAYKESKWKLSETQEFSLLQPLATSGVKNSVQPDWIQITPQQLISRYKQGFNTFHGLYKGVLPEKSYLQLKGLTETPIKSFRFPAELWAQIVYYYILDTAFRKDFAKGDTINSFINLYTGLIASLALEIQSVRTKLDTVLPAQAASLASSFAEKQVEELVNEFLKQKPDFLAAWEMRDESRKPLVPGVTYREFIPGVPLVVPLELTNKNGAVLATANGIYNDIFKRRKKEFERFVYERLETPENANSQEIGHQIENFMRQMEKEIDTNLLPGSLTSLDGTNEVVKGILRYFPRQDVFSLVPGMASWLLWQYPPSGLINKMGYSSLNELLGEYEPNDALALASWSEDRGYVEQLWSLLKTNNRPENFRFQPFKPLIVNNEDFPAVMAMKEIGALGKITGRLVISNLHKGMGGQLPKLFYLTNIAESIIEIETFSKIWHRFAEERTDFGLKIINSLESHWGRDPLSAHNIFENGCQRVLVDELKKLARRIDRQASKDPSFKKLATCLKYMADAYHLALTLPDSTFIACSAGTWANYSFEGGAGFPTPLSLKVEQDWSSQEFLLEYFKAIGGSEEAIEEKIIELMGEGREWEDLSPIILGRIKEAEEIVPEQMVTQEQTEAGVLISYAGNPVLKPINNHCWESTYVLNAGAIKINGRVYLVYRAVGEDKISRLGMAVSNDGYNFDERLPDPIFVPRGKSEVKGCEDPRLTLIDGRIYMVYTAYDGVVAQIALASIEVDDFLNYRWGTWRRHGLVFPGFTDKDGTLFPERFNGRFSMLHRVDPHMWITFSPHIRCPWSRREHKILAGARTGMVWDGLKIGGGAQPVKTEFGWMLITHGVDHAHVYRLGVVLLDLVDPRVLIYRSPNFILEPTEKTAIGEPGKSWVMNVVFSCGVVPIGDNKEIYGAEDEFLVYYGASDSVINVATAKIADLIPQEFR